jgi:hypothetical protein
MIRRLKVEGRMATVADFGNGLIEITYDDGDIEFVNVSQLGRDKTKGAGDYDNPVTDNRKS